MFVDIAEITVKSGNGGNGCVSFRREKYVEAGGPDGGDGGNGGSVILVADEKLSTLMDFRYKKKYAAPNGMDGSGKRMHGKKGEDLIVKVPKGTIVKDTDSGRVIADLSEPGAEFVAAKGGSGGWGNAKFATATRQVPSFAKAGHQGKERRITLELKLIADVGLIGFPNVGKSTILSVVSDARPKIANYHFTTLVPNLGVVQMDDGAMVLADIPGIIEGAHEGIGLGHEFLRHVERTRLLIHVVDVSGVEGRNPLDDFNLINEELKKYSEVLSQKIQIVAANKTDISDELYEEFKTTLEEKGYKVFSLSAATGKGVKELMDYTYTTLKDIPMVEFEIEEIPEEVIVEELFTVRRENETYVVEGEWITNLVNSTNFDDFESLSYFQRQLRKHGVIETLEKAGVGEGDTVILYDMEFDFER